MSHSSDTHRKGKERSEQIRKDLIWLRDYPNKMLKLHLEYMNKVREIIR